MRPGDPDITVAPVSRAPRLSADRIRRQLDLSDHSKLVVLTLGGIAVAPDQLDYDRLPEDIFLVVAGASDMIWRQGPVLLLPARSGVYHPDLIRAADVVIGKTGYSTVAEVFQADVPFGFVSRTRFREASVMAAFARGNLRAREVAATALQDGSWTSVLPALAALGTTRRNRPTGASQVAAFIVEILM